MAKHGTLPEYMNQRQCVVLDRPATFVLEETDEDDTHDTSEDHKDEYDASSDEEVEVEGADGVSHCSKGKLVVPQPFFLAHGPGLEELFASTIGC